MKRILIIIICTISIGFSLLWIHLERTEWVMKEKIYDLNIPLIANDGTIAKIEEQTKKVVIDKVAKPHLCEIKFISDSNDSFDLFTTGELQVVYYENIGNSMGFYKCERFIVYEIYVNLQKNLLHI